MIELSVDFAVFWFGYTVTHERLDYIRVFGSARFHIANCDTDYSYPEGVHRGSVQG